MTQAASRDDVLLLSEFAHRTVDWEGSRVLPIDTLRKACGRRLAGQRFAAAFRSAQRRRWATVETGHVVWLHQRPEVWPFPPGAPLTESDSDHVSSVPVEPTSVPAAEQRGHLVCRAGAPTILQVWWRWCCDHREPYVAVCTSPDTPYVTLGLHLYPARRRLTREGSDALMEACRRRGWIEGETWPPHGVVVRLHGRVVDTLAPRLLRIARSAEPRVAR
jgi:hypothetical protein